MDVYKSDSLLITLHQEVEQLWIECRQSFDLAEFKSMLLEALKVAKRDNVRQWLIDARGIGELTDEEENWLQLNFFPQLMNPQSTCYMAMVIAPSCYDRMLEENGWFGLKSYNTFIRLNTFYNLQDAEKWLLSNSTRSESASD